MSIQKRLRETIQTLKLDVREFEIRADLANGFVNNVGDSMRSKTIAKIKGAFPNIDMDYILYGKANATVVADDPLQTEVPLISIAARASFNYEYFNELSMVKEYAPIYKKSIKTLKKPILIDIDGDSMGPQLKSGTRVLADMIDPGDWTYATGVVGVSFGRQFVVKRIKDNLSIQSGIITLHSDNPTGGSLHVKLEDVTSMWKILEIVKSKVE